MITRAIKTAFEVKKQRNWQKTFWAFDIHGTILKPNYRKGNLPEEFYPYAKEVLQLISHQPDIVTILYTCSYQHEAIQYIEFFKTHGIRFDYVNENPEVCNDHGCYDEKPYFNVLFEDKAGFDPLEDWQKVTEFLRELRGEQG